MLTCSFDDRRRRQRSTSGTVPSRNESTSLFCETPYCPRVKATTAKTFAPCAAVIVLGACEDMDGWRWRSERGRHVHRAGGAAVPDLDIEASGSARLVVRQSGAEVTIDGSLTLAGVTTEIPAFTGRVSATGFFTTTEHGVSGTASDATCGRYLPRSSSLTFADGTARLVENVSTDYCGNIHLSGTLTR